jgi:hypothetical protein
MVIKINGNTADVSIDSEKTIGEVLAVMEQWLLTSGHRLSGLSIDGQPIDTSGMEKAFNAEIDKVGVLDIFTSSISELAASSLFNLMADTEEYENLSFDERSGFLEDWKKRPQAVFASEQMGDLYSAYINAFSNEGFSPDVLRSITEERLREVERPVDEFENIKELLEETCARLVDLPLDIQTGKDAKAAQTIQLFTGISEKIIRLYSQFENQGYIIPHEDNPVKVLINDFYSSVRELLQAYESNDTVLVGDLSEYEMAPRLKELYGAIEKNTMTQKRV